ncbi:hypothetical protein BU23DRAFT_590281 [Bimuria novae-zelandiae CBS 107.79]|uniref:UbiA prenyltransferase n=1 Tax=Bimuria novae-zelandiae CBS 107.79 TaxID=1447943 RepID=A0A6A5VAZ1_9PLEO|nr:hypothetical protein BU23DRAFT_590281 [Bimuria novae-zelandiae CBS 107.79]
MHMLPDPIEMSKAVAGIRYHLHTLYLFTANDFATFAIPTTFFATFASLSGSPMTSNPSPSLIPTLLRVPLALSIIWTNLLLFNISNQRSPTPTEEDRINKPLRPLPSARLTSEDARLLRNLLIALGYGLYSCAALCIIAGPAHDITDQGLAWVAVVTGVMFVTQHICDIKDAEGDRLRGRMSAPIVLGDKRVQWSVALPILLSSAVCPWFFDLGEWSYFCTLGMGGVVAERTLC